MTIPTTSLPIRVWLKHGPQESITASSFVRDRFTPDEIVVTNGDGEVVVVPRANIASIVLATIPAADEYYG
jgi:hypothetical protein